jgi:mono/diheme cytochrome c family protein
MQTKTKINKIVLLAALSGLLVAGCGKQQDKARKAVPAAGADSAAVKSEAAAKVPFRLKEGKRLFSQYCGVCHGESGDGSGQYFGASLQPQPANFTDKAFMKSLSEEKIIKVISDGSASVGKSSMCPPWGKTFNIEEIEFLAEYVKSLAGK